MAGEPGLHRDAIVRAALDVLDEQGYEGLSMRSVADALGVKAASLYWHVRNKRELLGLMTEAILGECVLPDPPRSWDEQLTILARELRRVLLARRDAARVFNGRFTIGVNALRAQESVAAALTKAGFSARTTSYALFTVTFYAVGFTQLEASIGYGPGVRAELDDIGDRLAALPAAEFPTVRELAGELVAPSLADRFEFGLRLLIDGLRVELSAESSG